MSAHHLQRLAQYKSVQTKHVWVLQVHHDRYLSQEVPKLCAHGAFRSHPEGLDSHWDLGLGGNTIRHPRGQLCQSSKNGAAGPGTQNEVGSLGTHILAAGQCPQPSVYHTKAARAQQLPSAHCTIWDQTLESPLWLTERQRPV